MEKTDRRIVDLLREDGRMSFTDLGRELGLSTSAVHQRVRRLEERGAIKGYAARLDYAQTGLPLTAFISITPLDPGAPDDVPDRLRHLPQIEECHSVAGDMSYVLKVRVAEPSALEELIAAVRAAANVTTRTTVVLSTPWE
ncbi:MAG TPA: Lrp/AsnC family transcriptional regulator [Phycicoccus sp.]|nr:Lrp/AsnC family transcriptional regulator [Phycicoccus sp.]